MPARRLLQPLSRLFILIVFSVSPFLGAKAQTPDSNQQDGTFALTETIEVSNANKAELLERAKAWLSTSPHKFSFVSEDMGMISVAGVVPFRSLSAPKKASVNGRVVYVATLLVQDGVFMYEYANFYHEADPKQPNPTDLGFLTTSEATNKDLDHAWEATVMEELRRQVTAAVEKETENLKKMLLNENPSFSLNVKGK